MEQPFAVFRIPFIACIVWLISTAGQFLPIPQIHAESILFCLGGLDIKESDFVADHRHRFPIMDFYLKACGDHLIRGFEAHDLRLLDVGKLDTLEQAEKCIV